MNPGGPSAATTVAAVIGTPVRHSRSPAIHNAAFAATGLDWTCVAFEVADGDAAGALGAMRVLGLGGLSVTMPHKEAVVAAVDEASDEVRALGAANCVVAVGGDRLRAENTDAAGFVRGLADDAGISVEGRRIVVLGAGGAARAVVAGVAAAGAGEVVVVNRTADRAAAAADLAGPVGRAGSTDDLATADVVVNATPLGMGASSQMPCPPRLLRRGQVVVDLVYDPLQTPWLAALRAAGVDSHNGLSMLVHQAALAFELWTGVEAPLGAMREAVPGEPRA